MRRLCAYAEALCRRVAPDAATGPFYAVLRSDLPPEYQGGDGGALAITSRHLDLMLRPTLERQRRWRGRGPAMLLDAAEIGAHKGNVGVGTLSHPARGLPLPAPRPATGPTPPVFLPMAAERAAKGERVCCAWRRVGSPAASGGRLTISANNGEIRPRSAAVGAVAPREALDDRKSQRCHDDHRARVVSEDLEVDAVQARP